MYTILMYLWDNERHLSNSIDYCKYYQPFMDTLAIESPLAFLLFLLTRLILMIWYTNICDPLCEIHAKVSKSNYEITSIKVWFLPLI